MIKLRTFCITEWTPNQVKVSMASQKEAERCRYQVRWCPFQGDEKEYWCHQGRDKHTGEKIKSRQKESVGELCER